MYKVLDTTDQFVLLKCDTTTFKIFEDVYDADPNNYEDLSASIDPDDVLDYIISVSNARATKKIHTKVSV